VKAVFCSDFYLLLVHVITPIDLFFVSLVT
jgi:hypothetical protein